MVLDVGKQDGQNHIWPSMAQMKRRPIALLFPILQGDIMWDRHGVAQNVDWRRGF